MDKLQKLYDSEINWAIETFWDGGFTAKLGDEMNGFKAEKTCDTLEEAADFLWVQAKKRYPDATAFQI